MYKELLSQQRKKLRKGFDSIVNRFLTFYLFLKGQYRLSYMPYCLALILSYPTQHPLNTQKIKTMYN